MLKYEMLFDASKAFIATLYTKRIFRWELRDYNISHDTNYVWNRFQIYIYTNNISGNIITFLTKILKI